MKAFDAADNSRLCYDQATRAIRLGKIAADEIEPNKSDPHEVAAARGRSIRSKDAKPQYGSVVGVSNLSLQELRHRLGEIQLPNRCKHLLR